MKHARGDIRKLLTIIGEIQDRVGMAKSWHENDRDPSAWERGQELLQEAFDLCIVATSPFYPVDMEEKENEPRNGVGSVR